MQDLQAAVFPVKSRKIKEMTLEETKVHVNRSMFSFLYLLSLPTNQEFVLSVIVLETHESVFFYYQYNYYNFLIILIFSNIVQS